MFDRILVPLDGSELAEAILPQLRRLPVSDGATVVLLRVLEVRPHDFTLDFPSLLNDARAYADRIARRLSEEGLRVRAIVRLGDPAGTILDVSHEERASLIALSTHGRSGVSRWALGSVAEKVLRSTDVPFLLIRAGSEEPPGPRAPRFARFLIPLDGSPLSFVIVAVAREFARRSGGRAVVLHVREEEGAAEIPAWLESAADRLAAEGSLEAVRVRTGNPAEAILEEARRSEADLILMGAQGRSAPSRWLLGSVAEKVLRASKIPVLVVRGEAGAWRAVKEAAEACWKE